MLEIAKNLTEVKLVVGEPVVHISEVIPLEYPQVLLASNLGQVLPTIERLYGRLMRLLEQEERELHYTEELSVMQL